MKPTTACVVTAIFAMAFVAVRCGGDSTGGDAGGGDATTDGEGVDGAASDGASDASDASAPKPDGCVPVEGGLACDPGHVTCGTTSCDLAKQFCCIDDGGASLTCDDDPPDSGGGPPPPPPPNGCTGTKATCDEAADCPSGQICCGFVGIGGGFATACETSCGNGLQFCRGSAECVKGDCVVQTCQGETVETCGSFCP